MIKYELTECESALLKKLEGEEYELVLHLIKNQRKSAERLDEVFKELEKSGWPCSLVELPALYTNLGREYSALRGRVERISEDAIRVYEGEVIDALEEYMDPQGDNAHHVQVALGEAAHILRGEPTADGRTNTPCPQCGLTYGNHERTCPDALDFPLGEESG